jgi:hypothetical protein
MNDHKPFPLEQEKKQHNPSGANEKYFVGTLVNIEKLVWLWNHCLPTEVRF